MAAIVTRNLRGGAAKKEVDLTMEDQEFRCIYKYFYLKAIKKRTGIKRLMRVIYNEMKDSLEKPPSYATIGKWIRQFKLGHMGTKDAFSDQVDQSRSPLTKRSIKYMI